jgi:hypothetical protein
MLHPGMLMCVCVCVCVSVCVCVVPEYEMQGDKLNASRWQKYLGLLPLLKSLFLSFFLEFEL